MAQYILASQSPRRKQLLEWAEIDFDITMHPTDESYPAHLQPDEIAIYVAEQKAIAVAKGIDAKTIIAADTIVVLDGRIIGKPQDRNDAINILSRLSNQTHLVITGVAIIRGDKKISFCDTTEVQFHPLTMEQIQFYVDKYQPYDKAGAYAIQEWIGVVGIKSIKGDFYNVMGLPVSRVVHTLQQFL
ncbi:MAG: septum formation protein Maf [Flavisolibacter sp.]|nr:septum formation protein Maf [Flavisolibacter sp.]MBD0375678.1 septum formation protein Maf [Flavisolibacter sp.]